MSRRQNGCFSALDSQCSGPNTVRPMASHTVRKMSVGTTLVRYAGCSKDRSRNGNDYPAPVILLSSPFQASGRLGRKTSSESSLSPWPSLLRLGPSAVASGPTADQRVGCHADPDLCTDSARALNSGISRNTGCRVPLPLNLDLLMRASCPRHTGGEPSSIFRKLPLNAALRAGPAHRL